MIQLHDKETGKFIGTISDAQLAFLVDQLEEESPRDQDYYLNRDMVDNFEQGGADPELVRLLRTALGDRPEMEIQWSR